MGAGEEIVDGSGPDLRVYELGSRFNPSWSNDDNHVFVSEDRTDWHKLGTGDGTSEFDLAKSGLSAARYVKLEGIVYDWFKRNPGPQIESMD